MQFEQAVKVVSSALQPKIARPLTEVELALLFGAWNNLTYDRIAERSGYSINYLQRDIAPKFWKLLSDVLGRQVNKTNLRAVVTYIDDSIPNLPPQIPNSSAAQNSTDWGEAIDVTTFHGRVAEINTLTQWIIDARCRLITLVGMGGMGKTALETKVARDLQEQFEFVIWRTLRNAPSLETLLTDLVPFLSNQQSTKPELAKLLDCWRKSRCLVILDNLETLLHPEQVGQFQAGFEDYEELLRLAGEVDHTSCILLTSREKPALVASLEGIELTTRSLKIDGSPEAARAIIQAKGLVGTEQQQQMLGDRYSNCPLALKIVATSIQELFDGSIGDFLPKKLGLKPRPYRAAFMEFSRSVV
jgi:hypothetical protein